MNDGDEVDTHESHGGELLMVMRMRGQEDTEVVFAQVPLLRSQLDALKRRSGTITTKDALTVAVHHYLHCPALDDDDTNSDAGTRAERDDGGEYGQGEKEDWWWTPTPPVKRAR